MSQKEGLKTTRLRILINETLETDILIKRPPMNPYSAEFILFALFRSRNLEVWVPQKRLAIYLFIVSQTIKLVSVKPYFYNPVHP